MRSKQGFALTEALLAMAVLTMSMQFVLKASRFPQQDYYLFPDRYLEVQSDALRQAKTVPLNVQEDSLLQQEIHFSPRGNINQARTLTFRNGRKIILELGPGRLVFRDE
jgi:hypothetical protein